MTRRNLLLHLRSSPHLHAPLDVARIMRQVLYALLPLCALAVYLFGLSALLLLITVVLSCVLSEYLLQRAGALPGSLADGSALVSGVLLALTLPPGFPLWMGAVAGAVAMLLGKALFGGLGHNIFNPALLGRAFVQAAFPGAITSWQPALVPERFTTPFAGTLAWPLQQPAADAISGATPLGQFKFDHADTALQTLLLGTHAGSLGETSTLLILLCGLYLALRGMLNWRIPLAVLLGAGASAWLFHLYDPGAYPTPAFVLGSGGLMLGAWFMATDPVGAPVTPRAIWLFGGLIGVLTVIIRLFGALPEGVMYAILLGNALAPGLDQLTPPRVYGHSRSRP